MSIGWKYCFLLQLMHHLYNGIHTLLLIVQPHKQNQHANLILIYLLREHMGSGFFFLSVMLVLAGYVELEDLNWLIYQVFNFSTGRIINKAVFDSEVTSMDHDHTGQLIFCGDLLVSPCIYCHWLYKDFGCSFVDSLLE